MQHYYSKWSIHLICPLLPNNICQGGAYFNLKGIVAVLCSAPTWYRSNTVLILELRMKIQYNIMLLIIQLEQHEKEFTEVLYFYSKDAGEWFRMLNLRPLSKLSCLEVHNIYEWGMEEAEEKCESRGKKIKKDGGVTGGLWDGKRKNFSMMKQSVLLSYWPTLPPIARPAPWQQALSPREKQPYRATPPYFSLSWSRLLSPIISMPCFTSVRAWKGTKKI